MDLATYRQRRQQELRETPVFRRLCLHCRQPDFSCFCAWLRPFDPLIEFVILIHPVEFKRRIATGRMSHLSLKNSRLLLGEDFSRDRQIEAILADPSLHSVMLYPGRQSQNLTPMTVAQRRQCIPAGKKLAVFVIDGTWNTAKKMVRLSENLKDLPRICFTPPVPSTFRVRRQPRPECYSTIEAVHQTIELMGPACGYSTTEREHDSLLELFDKMIRRQIDLAHCMPNRLPPLNANG